MAEKWNPRGQWHCRLSLGKSSSASMSAAESQRSSFQLRLNKRLAERCDSVAEFARSLDICFWESQNSTDRDTSTAEDLDLSPKVEEEGGSTTEHNCLGPHRDASIICDVGSQPAEYFHVRPSTANYFDEHVPLGNGENSPPESARAQGTDNSGGQSLVRHQPSQELIAKPQRAAVGHRSAATKCPEWQAEAVRSLDSCSNSWSGSRIPQKAARRQVSSTGARKACSVSKTPKKQSPAKEVSAKVATNFAALKQAEARMPEGSTTASPKFLAGVGTRLGEFDEGEAGQQCTRSLNTDGTSFADLAMTAPQNSKVPDGLSKDAAIANALEKAQSAADALQSFQEQQRHCAEHERKLKVLREALLEAACQRDCVLNFDGGADIAEAAATLERRQRAARQKLATALRQLPGNQAAVKDMERMQELSPWLAGEPAAPVQEGDVEALSRQLSLLGGQFVTLQSQRLFSSLEEVVSLGDLRPAQLAWVAVDELYQNERQRSQLTLVSVDVSPDAAAFETLSGTAAAPEAGLWPGTILGGEETGVPGTARNAQGEGTRNGTPVWPQTGTAGQCMALRQAFLQKQRLPVGKKTSKGKVGSRDSQGAASARQSVRSPMASPTGHRATELSSTIMQANAGGRQLSKILRLDLGLERLSSLGNSLAFCTQLRSLTLSNNCLASLDGLHFCRGLTELHADGNQLPTLSTLSSLPDLRVLTAGQNRLQDLCWLHACNQLERLEVAGNQLTSLRCWLPSSLVQANLACNRLSDLQGLQGCSRLQQLDVSSNVLTSLDELAGCQLLLRLDASYNQLSAFPGALPAALLTHLSLQANRLTSLAGLPWLPHLQALYLQDNDIRWASPILGAPSLSILNLAYNKVENGDCLFALSSLPALRRLDLTGCPLEQHPGTCFPIGDVGQHSYKKKITGAWTRYQKLRQLALPRLTQDEDKSAVPAEALHARWQTSVCHFLGRSGPSERSFRCFTVDLGWRRGTAEGTETASKQAAILRLILRQRAEQEAWHRGPHADSAQSHAARSSLHDLLLTHWQQMASDQIPEEGWKADWITESREREEVQSCRAATRIQAAWRVHFARGLTRTKQAEKRGSMHTAAAIKIQAAARGMLVRARVRAARRAARLSTSGSELTDVGDVVTATVSLAEAVLEDSSTTEFSLTDGIMANGIYEAAVDTADTPDFDPIGWLTAVDEDIGSQLLADAEWMGH